MTKKESLTESMRRLSNIVTEAEQLNEEGPKEFVAKQAGSALGPFAKILGGFFARHFKAADQRRVAGSTVRQYENIQYLAKSFERALGDDPNQWADKIDDYFKNIHITTRQTVVDKSAAFDHGVGQKLGTDERVKKIMGQFNAEFAELVEACKEYALDRYSIEPRSQLSKTSKRILEKIRSERHVVQVRPANYLEAVYKELMLDIEATLLPKRVKRYLAFLMAFFGFVAYAEVTGLRDKAKADWDEKRRSNPDIHWPEDYQDTEAPNPFDGGTNTTPRRASGSRVYFPDTD